MMKPPGHVCFICWRVGLYRNDGMHGRLKSINQSSLFQQHRASISHSKLTKTQKPTLNTHKTRRERPSERYIEEKQTELENESK